MKCNIASDRIDEFSKRRSYLPQDSTIRVFTAAQLLNIPFPLLFPVIQVSAAVAAGENY